MYNAQCMHRWVGEYLYYNSLSIVMINVVFEHTPFWALGVYGRILKAPIPQYTAVCSGVYGRILRVYGRILGVFVCTMWLLQVENFHCVPFVPILLHSLPLPSNCTPRETNLGSYFTHDCNVCLHMCPFQSIL